MPANPRPPVAEDDALELPPLDGEDDEAPADDDDEALAVDDLAGDPYDDAEAGDGYADGELGDVVERSWLDDAEGDDALDVGADAEIEAEEEVLEGADSPGIPEEELDVVEASEPVDSGEEGPVAPDEELREEDLPALDADDDGLFEEDDVVEGALEEVPRAACLYERVASSPPLGEPHAAALAGASVLVAAGESLWLIGASGEVVGAWAGPCDAVGTRDDAWVASFGGQVRVSRDHGRTWAPDPSASASLAPPPPPDLAVRPGTLEGSLWLVEEGPDGPEVVFELPAESDDEDAPGPALVVRAPALGLVWLVTPRGAIVLRPPSA